MQRPEELAARITRSAERLFGNRELGTALALEADRYQRDCESIRTRRGLQGTTIAFTGPTGQGKTSLVRALIRDAALRERLPAGVRATERSTRVTWIGPQRPDALEAEHEDHLPAAVGQLEDVGRPIAIIDTPGWSNRSGRLVQIAEDALHDAELHVLVVKRDSIERSDVIGQAQRSAGAAVLPVVRTRDPDEPSLPAELDAFHAALREGGGTVFRPLVVPDGDVGGPEAWDDIRARLVAGLQAAIAAMPSPESLIATRLDARTRRLRRRVQQVLASVHTRVQQALDELETEAARLPADVVRAALGEERVLEAGLRSRMRVELSENTWALWFPYRPVLAVVQLTYGVWDRLVLAMGGSLPSWFGTLFAAGRQLWNAASFDAALAGLRERVTTSSADRLGPLLARFDRALAGVSGGEPRSVGPGEVTLEGLSELQDASAAMVRDVVTRHTVSSWLANLWGLLCTALFWSLFSGPIVYLYRTYLSASSEVFLGGDPVRSFPDPTMSFWLTSLALSLLPVLLATVIFVSAALSRRRLRRAAREVREAHEARIEALHQEGVLRLTLSDERLADARFLLQL